MPFDIKTIVTSFMNARLADQNRKHKILFQALLDKRKCKTYCKSYDLDLCWYLGDYRKYHIEIKKTPLFSSPGRMSGELLSSPRCRRRRWRLRARAQKL